MNTSPKIAVIGLGYVGLPLAVALSRRYQVTGFDIDSRRCYQAIDKNAAWGELAR